MRIVRTDSLQEDMLLHEDVRDINGRLLLGKGEKIQSKHIRFFKIWGIPEVNVVESLGNEESSASSVEPRLLEEIEKNARYVFSRADLDHPAIKELFRLSVLFRSENKDSETRELVIIPGAEGEKATDDFSMEMVRKIIEKDIKLPEIPSIVSEMNEVIADPFASSGDIAEVVKKSPSLSANLLKIVNASFYGFPFKISSIAQAVTMIGTKEINSLTLGISVIATFKDIRKNVFDMHAFLKHSLACGIISRILAAHKNIPQTEQLFVSGLLHDIGRLIIYKNFPDQARNLLSRSTESGRLLYEEESMFFGGRHTDIGRYLSRKWNFPLSLENDIFYHHNPSSAHNPTQAAIVHLADIIVNALGIGGSGERFVPPLDSEAWTALRLSPGIFEVVIKQAIHQLFTFDAFLHS